MTITTTPPKGTKDWLPPEFSVRKYIFDTWRRVCTSFGYQEYLTPLVEYADVYEAKSGEDVGGPELTTFLDRGGRELAIRPEMTPSVTRMVSQIYNSAPKPLRLFSIANFYRNENPQRGRNREFWQLNYDIFGAESLAADIEILQIAIRIMLAFNPPTGSFTVKINSRKLIEQVIADIPKDQLTEVFRILDKYEKVTPQEISDRLTQIGLTQVNISKLLDFLSQETSTDPDIVQILDNLKAQGLGAWVKFSPQVLRGFDYYDGMVFEVFDNNPANRRAMFGGGRYNGLASIFGAAPFPAVGCAPGDETTRLFLESWNLLPTTTNQLVYLPLLDSSLYTSTQKIAQLLRTSGQNVEIGLETESISKALQTANKRMATSLVFYGTQEAQNKQYTIKDLTTGTQQTFSLDSNF